MKHILLIDDDPLQHELYSCYVLKSERYQIIPALDVADASEILSSQEIDLILLDSLIPPYPDFTETVAQIREKGYRKDIVVVAADIEKDVFKKHNDYTVKTCWDKQHISMHNFSDMLDMVA
ncbi:MAG: response regulator [Rhizobiaceae bacterium]|nr:response regulator [Rhizobiaceae bacterium]